MFTEAIPLVDRFPLWLRIVAVLSTALLSVALAKRFVSWLFAALGTDESSLTVAFEAATGFRST